MQNGNLLMNEFNMYFDKIEFTMSDIARKENGVC